MKFYPQDWRADEKLRMCSLAARGLWIEMLAIMHRSERYGHLMIGGRVPTDAQLAVQVGAAPDDVTVLLKELSDADVFSRSASGSIYSRRMTRDHKKAENSRRNGRKGGNPALSLSTGKDDDNSGQDNLGDKLPDKGGDKAQKPEARSQISASADIAREIEPDLPALARRLCQAAGLEMPDPFLRFDRHSEYLELTQSWLTAGADPESLEQCVAARAASLGHAPKSLRYFDGAVREGIEARQGQMGESDRLVEQVLKRARA